MFAPGCIELSQCGDNKMRPAGIATRNPALCKGVTNFHADIIMAAKEMMEAYALIICKMLMHHPSSEQWMKKPPKVLSKFILQKATRYYNQIIIIKVNNMELTKGELLITQEDYEILHTYIKGVKPVKHLDRKNTALLQDELKKATLVKNDELPEGVVRLNSRVIVKEETRDKLIELVLVTPEKADIKERKISIFAPLGIALIGYSQGEKVIWDVPAGRKTFTILKVTNQED